MPAEKLQTAHLRAVPVAAVATLRPRLLVHQGGAVVRERHVQVVRPTGCERKVLKLHGLARIHGPDGGQVQIVGPGQGDGGHGADNDLAVELLKELADVRGVVVVGVAAEDVIRTRDLVQGVAAGIGAADVGVGDDDLAVWQADLIAGAVETAQGKLCVHVVLLLLLACLGSHSCLAHVVEHLLVALVGLPADDKGVGHTVGDIADHVHAQDAVVHKGVV